MNFISSGSSEAVVAYLAETINEQLSAGKDVVWLLSGGSAIQVAVAAGKRLSGALGHLTITLVDERFGEPGHDDSNWTQLMAAGFSVPRAKLVSVLDGHSFDDTVASFSSLLAGSLDQDHFTIALLGIGPDGHAAGILPGSSAVTATGLAAGYDGGKFQRITMTAPAIALLDEAVVYAVGEAKWPHLEQLRQTVDPAIQPAQILKSAQKLTIFNDHIGAEA